MIGRGSDQKNRRRTINNVWLTKDEIITYQCPGQSKFWYKEPEKQQIAVEKLFVKCDINGLLASTDDKEYHKITKDNLPKCHFKPCELDLDERVFRGLERPYIHKFVYI